MHSYHEGLPGFSPAQLLHDGCAECESRAGSRDHGIANLDRHNFRLAWQRSAQWNTVGVPDIARAEIPMLSVLWSVQLHLERYGFPIGQLPGHLVVLDD
jgi:hypothetical protein